MRRILYRYRMLRAYIRTFLRELGKLENETWVSKLFHHGRYFGRYCRYAEGVDQVLANDMPWFNFEAIDYLDKVLSRDMTVFEYGSGGSTLFLSKRVRMVGSVEHDKNWYRRVQRELEERGTKNCKILLSEPEPASSVFGYDNPESCVSLSEYYQGQSFKKYVHSIEEDNDSEFDVVIVDGRARPSSFEASYRRVKPGGYLVLDNSEREQYQYIHTTLDNLEWEKLSFFGPGPYVRYFWGTTFWKRQQ